MVCSIFVRMHSFVFRHCLSQLALLCFRYYTKQLSIQFTIKKENWNHKHIKCAFFYVAKNKESVAHVSKQSVIVQWYLVWVLSLDIHHLYSFEFELELFPYNVPSIIPKCRGKKRSTTHKEHVQRGDLNHQKFAQIRTFWAIAIATVKKKRNTRKKLMVKEKRKKGSAWNSIIYKAKYKAKVSGGQIRAFIPFNYRHIMIFGMKKKTSHKENFYF